MPYLKFVLNTTTNKAHAHSKYLQPHASRLLKLLSPVTFMLGYCHLETFTSISLCSSITEFQY